MSERLRPYVSGRDGWITVDDLKMSASSQNRLRDIFFAHNGNLSDKWEQYLAIYDAEFGHFPEAGKGVSVLEIGVQNGGSLQIWAKYFPAGSRITGIDVDKACGALELGPNIEVCVGDASDRQQLDEMLSNATFDVIIDDGSHRSDHIIATFLACFDRLRPGGVYAIEDLHCSYMASFGGGFRKAGAAIEFFKALSDVVNYDHFESDPATQLNSEQQAFLRSMNRSVASITFYDSVVTIHKLPAEKSAPYRRLMTGSAMPVLDPSANVAGETPARLREFVLSPSAATAFEPNVLATLAATKEQVDRLVGVNERVASELRAANLRLDDLSSRNVELTRARQHAERTQQQSAEEVRALKEARMELTSRLNQANVEAGALRQRLDEILNSTSWRLASPIRVLGTQVMHRSHLLRRVVAAKRATGGWKPLARVVRRTWRESGFRGVMRRSIQVDAGQLGTRDTLADRLAANLSEIRARFDAPVSGLMEHGDGPLLSVIMPVYRTPLDALRQAIDSVRQQTYANWELCIVDDASKDERLREVLDGYAQRDKRIKLRICDENGGISRATNVALEMASGQFVVLFDHDDLLTYDALEEMVAAIKANPPADLFYSDECKVDADGTPVEIYSKPDWSPLLMMSSMYIGHLSVYRRELLDQVGPFRSEFDFSQDYDMALRATELAREIVHVPKVLYGWRMIAASGAAGGKPYARISNIKALQEAANRRGWRAEAVPLPTANYLKWDIEESDRALMSIIVPSDNETNIRATVDSIREKTDYDLWEVLVVTNSGIVDQLAPVFTSDARVRFVRYDKPFNFSDKCNAGAAEAKGNYVVFFNDDVRVVTEQWIQRLIEMLRLPGVGAVAPKLLYENGTIQHAGMVTGVRRLVGTAFHCLEGDTTRHYNFAQCIREVSLLCGACIALPASVFRQVEGFDAENAPISHSDVDLCFKVREIGLTCVYTPYAELIHIGHASIGETEKSARREKKAFKQDKADIYLLRRWAELLSHDPYYTKPMREQLYHDSPERFELFAPQEVAASGGLDILLIAHDLTMSGAPRLLFEIATFLKRSGHFVVVASPEDGAYRQPLIDLGIPVICDELVLKGTDHFFDLAKNFDIVVGNTVLSWRDLARLAGYTRTYLYSHEAQIVSDRFVHMPGFADAIRNATGVMAASERAASHLRQIRADIDIVPGYGAEDLDGEPYQVPIVNRDIVVTLIGSKEVRKGQDIALDAIEILRKDVGMPRVLLQLFGRDHDPDFVGQLDARARNMQGIKIGPELKHDDYLEALKASDVVLSAARDDTLPLVSLDALALGRVVVCTKETGTSDFLEDGVSGFIAEEATPHAVATAIGCAIGSMKDWPSIGAAARAVFDANFTRPAFHARICEVLKLASTPVANSQDASV